MKSPSFLSSGKAGLLLLCATTLISLTGCDPYFGPGYGGGMGYGAYAPAFGRSNYIYYPRYATYYHPQSGMYHYMNGGSWASGRSPWGVSHNILRSSPSVPLFLNSHPQYHHNNVLNYYPRNWTQPRNWHH